MKRTDRWIGAMIALCSQGCSVGPAEAAPTTPAAKPAIEEHAPVPVVPTQPVRTPPAPAPMLEHTEHILRSAPREGRMQRFRIPLARARFGLVELGYTRAVVDVEGPFALIFNGGYWAYRGNERVIQGLLVVNDQPYAPRAGSSGGVLRVRAGAAELMRTEDYAPGTDTALAIQCSPRLVVEGTLVPKLDAIHRAARTALCVGHDSSVLDVYLTGDGVRPTLRELAEFLRAEGCQQALNLDGGPSTGAVAQTPAGPLRVGYGAPVPYALSVNVRP